MPFPFTDLAGSKKRPAVIISPNWYNERYEDVVVVAVTRQSLHDRVQLVVAQEDMQSGTILKNSYVRFTKVFTINKSQIVKVFAALSQDKMNEIFAKIKEFFSSQNA